MWLPVFFCYIYSTTFRIINIRYDLSSLNHKTNSQRRNILVYRYICVKNIQLITRWNMQCEYIPIHPLFMEMYWQFERKILYTWKLSARSKWSALKRVMDSFYKYNWNWDCVSVCGQYRRIWVRGDVPSTWWKTKDTGQITCVLFLMGFFIWAGNHLIRQSDWQIFKIASLNEHAD